MQNRIDRDELGYMGGGGGGGPSLWTVTHAAKKKKVAHLLQAVENSFRALFPDYSAIDDDHSAFSAPLSNTTGTYECLLILDVAASTRKKGLRFDVWREGMVSYLAISGEDEQNMLRGIFPIEQMVEEDERSYGRGWFKTLPQIDAAADGLGARRETLVR